MPMVLGKGPSDGAIEAPKSPPPRIPTAPLSGSDSVLSPGARSLPQDARPALVMSPPIATVIHQPRVPWSSLCTGGKQEGALTRLEETLLVGNEVRTVQGGTGAATRSSREMRGVSQQTGEAMLRRLLDTVVFLRHYRASSSTSSGSAPASIVAPSSPDQSKLLVLVRVAARCRHDSWRLALAPSLERILYFIRQYAHVFFDAEDCRFVESFLSGALSIPQLRQHAVETAIGILKYADRTYTPASRCVAILRMGEFLSSHLLFNLPLHPSADVLSIVLVKHVRLKDYPDYRGFSAYYRSRLIAAALSAMRSVLFSHLIYSNPGANELPALVGQYATVSCTVLSASRPCDDFLHVQVEAVRLLLTCARYEHKFYPIAYQAGIFILRRELENRDSASAMHSSSSNESNNDLGTVFESSVANTVPLTPENISKSKEPMSQGGSLQSPRAEEAVRGAEGGSPGKAAQDTAPNDEAVPSESGDSSIDDGDDGGVPYLKENPAYFKSLYFLARALFFGIQAHIRSHDVGDGRKMALLHVGSDDGTLSSYRVEPSVDSLNSPGHHQISLTLTALSDILLSFAISQHRALNVFLAPAVVEAARGLFFGRDRGPGHDGIDLQVSEERFYNTMGYGTASMVAPQGIEMLTSVSTSDLDDILQAILCLVVDVAKKELAIARSSVIQKIFRDVSNDYFAHMLKFQSVSYQRSIGVLSSTSKISSKQRVQMVRELSRQMRVLEYVGHLTLRFDDKNLALSMFPVLVEMLSYAKPFIAVKTISHFLVKCCIILGDEYFDIVLDLFCCTFSRSFDLVLRGVFNNMVNSRDSVNAVDGTVSDRIVETAEILGGVASGLVQLIRHASNTSDLTADSHSPKLFPVVDVSDVEAAVVLARCAKLKAIQRLLLNTYVELSGKFLQLGLDFATSDNFKGSLFGNRGRDIEAFVWFIAGKTSASDENQKARKTGVLESVSLSGCLFILLDPMSTCFQQLHFHLDAIELWRHDAALVEAWTDNDMMQRYLKAYAEDVEDPILLRSFWQYLALFHLSQRSPLDSLLKSHDSVSLMAKYCGPLLSLLHQSRSPVLGHNHRHWLSMELEECQITRVVESWASVSDEFGAMHVKPRKRSKALKILNAVLSKIQFPPEVPYSSVCFSSASHISVERAKDYIKFRGDVAVPVGVLSVLLKSTLANILASDIPELSFEERLLITGVRCIESLRSQFRADSSHHADMDHLLSYLDSIEDQSSAPKRLKSLIQLTVLDAFASWCYSLGDRLLHDTWAESRDCVVARNVVVSTLNTLLRRFASPLSASRGFVVLFIYKIINTFAWALWHPSTVYCMLDQLTELEYAKFNLVSKDTMVLSQIGDEVAAVEALRSEHFSAITVEYISLCYHWCSMGYKLSSALMNSILVDYQLDRSSALEAMAGNGLGNAWNGTISPDIPLGISIANEMASSNAPIFHTVHPSSDAEFLRVTAASDSAVAQKSAELLLGLRKLFKRDKKSKKMSIDFWSRESAGALSIERRISAVNIAMFVEKSSHFKALQLFFDISKDVKIRPRNNFLLRLYDQPGPVYPHNINPLEILASAAPNIDQASRAYVRGILMNKFPSFFAHLGKRHMFSGRRVLRPYHHDHHLLNKIQTKIPFSSSAARASSSSAPAEMSEFNFEMRKMFEQAIANCSPHRDSHADLESERSSALTLETFVILCGCYLATRSEFETGSLDDLNSLHRSETATVFDLLGQSLILNFNPRMARVVVSAFRWVLSASPGLSSRIWSEISRVIVWSSDLHRGIFRSRFEKISIRRAKHVEDGNLVGVPEPFDAGDPVREGDQARNSELRGLVEAEIGAHSVLISFMEELWVTVGDSSGILFGMLENVLLHATKLMPLYAPSRYSVSNSQAHFASHFKSPQLLFPLIGILTLALKCLKSYKRNGHPEFSSTKDRLEAVAASAKNETWSRLEPRPPQSVCLARRRILRERVYEWALSFFNGPKGSLSAYSEDMGTSDTAHERDTNLEIRMLIRFLDHIESDAELWRAEYSTKPPGNFDAHKRKGHGQCLSANVAGPGLQDVLARVENALVRCKRPSSNAFKDGPTSILCGKPIGGIELSKFKSFFSSNPTWIFERTYRDQALRLQRLCGIDSARLVLRAKENIASDDPDMFVVGESKSSKHIRQSTGVLHLMKFLIHLELKRLYAWQTVSYSSEAASRLPLSDYAKSIVDSNVSRRSSILKYAEMCASPSSIQTAILSAWTFHPSLALNIDCEFRYRRLTATDGALGARERFYGSACLLDDESGNAEDLSDSGTSSSDEKDNLMNNINLPKIVWKRIFDASVPRISDLIAVNPLCLHGDYRSCEYILGIGGDVLYHMDLSNKSKSFSSSRTISKLKLWSMHGDKTIRTMLSRLTHVVPEYTPVNFGSRVSHRSAYCPVYMLSHWQSCPPDVAIMLLQRPILGADGKSMPLYPDEILSDPQRIPEHSWAHDLHNHAFVVQYAIRSLSEQPPGVLMFYLPQLVQLIRQDSLGAIRIFLQELAKQSDLLCHQLIWLLETESVSEPIKHGAKKRKDASNMLIARSYGYCGALPGVDPLPKMAQGLMQVILSSLPRKSLEYMNLECEYFNRVTDISAKLSLVKDKSLHNAIIKEALVEMGLYNGLYLPTHPEKLVVGVDVTSGAPMQSAAKCPFLLVFHTVDWAGPDSLRAAASEGDGGSRALEQGRSTRSRTVISETVERPVSSILTNSVSPQSLQRIGLPASTEVHDGHLSEPSDDGSTALEDEEEPPGDGPDRPQLRTNRSFKKSSQTLFIHNTVQDDASGDASGDDEASVDVDITEGHTVRNRGSGKRRSRKETIRGAVANDMLIMREGEKRASPRFNTAPASVAKEFRRSLNMLSRSRGLRKGVQKWTSFTGDAKSASDKVNTSSMTSLSRRDRSSGGHQPLDGVLLSANGSLKVSDTACIFKVYDDCRQDAMTIQLVRILHDAYRNVHGMPLYLYPYAVVPNRTGAKKAMGGIIQVIPNVKSRDDIGKSGAKTLLQMFRAQYGGENSAAFRKAQRAFACSQAAYAVVSYLLLIKDRHNGNLVIDSAGHVIHIDFGFLLGISPGGNLGFETAAFKLSAEMFELLGGDFTAEPFLYFLDMTVKAFLIARELKSALLAIIASFADSGFPCFMHKADNIQRFLARFVPEMSDEEAAEHMKKLALDACKKWTTIVYDGIQKLQNNIYSDTWK